MKILEAIRRFFRNAPTSPFYTFQVRCKRCGEIVAGRLNLNNDLSLEFEDNQSYYVGRKVLMGSGLCFEKIEVLFRFSPDRRLLSSEISRGDFV